MNVTFSCSRCEKTSRYEMSDPTVGSSSEKGAVDDADAGGNSANNPTTHILCSHCQERVEIPKGAFEEGHLSRCLVCPSDDLFVRKDFSQRWGVSIIIFGFLLSSIALAMRYHMITFAILGVTAIIDAVLYWYTGNVLTCYRCHSEYRDTRMEVHPRFDLEVHERYRQQAARQQQAEQEQGVVPEQAFQGQVGLDGAPPPPAE